MYTYLLKEVHVSYIQSECFKKSSILSLISRIIILEFIIFLHFSNFFFKESNWENLGFKLEKNILFCIGNGAEYRPQIRQIKSPDTWCLVGL